MFLNTNNFRWRTPILLLIFSLFFFRNSFTGNLPGERLNFGRFTITYAFQDEGTALQIVRILENSLPRFRRIFNQRIKNRVKIVVLANPGEQYRLFKNKIPRWAGAVFLMETRTIIVKSPRWSGSIFNLQTDVKHELSHLFLHDFLGPEEISVWFDEGLAMLMSGKQISWWDGVTLSNALIAQKILEFEQIDDVLNFNERKARIAYLESQSAVRFLIRQLPEHNIAMFLQKVKNSNLNEALLASLGMDEIDFEIKWYRYLEKNYKWYFFFNFTDLIWVGLLFVLILAYVMVRSRNKKRLRSWAAEENMDRGFIPGPRDLPEEKSDQSSKDEGQ